MRISGNLYVWMHLESVDFTWRVQRELRRLLLAFSRGDPCLLRQECAKYYVRFCDPDDRVYSRLLAFCEKHPEVLSAPGYAARHGWNSAMRDELCHCIDTITDRDLKETQCFQRAAKFSDTVPGDLPLCRPRHNHSLHLSIDDIPDFDHSGSWSCTALDYNSLLRHLSKFPCDLTPEWDPPKSYGSDELYNLRRCLRKFN